MAKGLHVARPTKRSEFTIVFASLGAEKGWRDLVATIRGPVTDSWEFLTKTPTERTLTNYPLRGELAVVTHRGRDHDRWQHKPTRQGDARIWFFVDGQTVYLEQVHTAHPHQTK